MKNPHKPDWTIRKLIAWCTSYFKEHQIDSPRTDAEILLAHALKLTRIDLYLRYDQPLNRSELLGFKELIKRRIKREPVAYITGKKEFWSLDLLVTRDVLIPRPDTECLVETALKHLHGDSCSESKYVLELGTGSGAVILALASKRPNHKFFASDKSIRTVDLARQNAKHLNLDRNIHFISGYWFAPIKPNIHLFDMIVSNPPYIPKGDIKNLQAEISEYEPVEALDGGDDGLRSIADIIYKAHEYLKPKGYLLLEIGYNQSEGVKNLIDNSGYYENEIFIKDYAGYNRVIEMRKK